MSKAKPKNGLLNNSWRTYLIVIQSVGLLGVLAFFRYLLLATVSFGMIKLPVGSEYTAGHYTLGAYLLAMMAVDSWILLGVFHRQTHARWPVWISFGLTVGLAFYAVAAAPGSWQTDVFFPLVVLFSWTKVLAVQRMLFMTRIQLPAGRNKL